MYLSSLEEESGKKFDQNISSSWGEDTENHDKSNPFDNSCKKFIDVLNKISMVS